MLESFVVSHKTDGKTVCRIIVEPQAKRCSATVTIDRLIAAMRDESDYAFIAAEWNNIEYWERKAAAIAKAWSPFWRGETAA